MTLFTRMADLLLGTTRRSTLERRDEREIHAWTPAYKEDPL
jgi:hypothetical protein